MIDEVGRGGAGEFVEEDAEGSCGSPISTFKWVHLFTMFVNFVARLQALDSQVYCLAIPAEGDPVLYRIAPCARGARPALVA